MKMHLSQGSRAGTQEDPFLRGYVDVTWTEVTFEEAGNPSWSVLWGSRMPRHIRYNDDVFINNPEAGSPGQGPSTVKILETSGGVKLLTVSARIPFDDPSAPVYSASAYLWADKSTADVPNQTLDCGDGRILISVNQRKAAMDNADLIRVAPPTGSSIPTYSTILLKDQFLAKYPYFGDEAPEEPDQPDTPPEEPDQPPESATVKIFCGETEEELKITPSQRNSAEDAGDLMKVAVSIYFKWVTPLEIEEFLDKYPFPDEPEEPEEPEPEKLATFQHYVIKPDNRYYTIRSAQSELDLDRYWGGTGVQARINGREVVDDHDLGRLLNIDVLTNRETPNWRVDQWPDDPPWYRFENPTLGGSLNGPAVFYPRFLEQGKTYVRGLTQMPDFWGIPEPGVRSPRWMDYWCEYLWAFVGNQLLVDFSVYHTYSTPQPIWVVTLSQFIEVNFYDKIHRPEDGQGTFYMPAGFMRMSGPYGSTLLYCPDPTVKFIGGWHVGNQGTVNNIQQVIDKPQGAYTAHTGIRWHPNDMKVAPDTKIHCRAVVSLDGDLSQAADVYSAEWIKPTEPVDYHYFGPVQTQGLFETAMVFTAGPKGAAIEVVFYDALGMPMQESSNYALAPHCRLSEPQLKVPQGAGTVEVVSDQPVHIYALVRHVSLDRTEISYIADYRLEQV